MLQLASIKWDPLFHWTRTAWDVDNSELILSKHSSPLVKARNSSMASIWVLKRRKLAQKYSKRQICTTVKRPLCQTCLLKPLSSHNVSVTSAQTFCSASQRKTFPTWTTKRSHRKSDWTSSRQSTRKCFLQRVPSAHVSLASTTSIGSRSKSKENSASSPTLPARRVETSTSGTTQMPIRPIGSRTSLPCRLSRVLPTRARARWSWAITMWTLRVTLIRAWPFSSRVRADSPRKLWKRAWKMRAWCLISWSRQSTFTGTRPSQSGQRL